MSKVCAVILATPDGPFTIMANPQAVLGSGWTANLDELRGRIHPSLRPESVKLLQGDAPQPELLSSAAKAVDDYYAGQYNAPAGIPVLQKSGPFRCHAWDVLRQVEPGAPISYAQFALRTGHPTAVRAAAAACSHNSAALFIPCHRVIRTDGNLGGFLYGLEVKESLLRRESGRLAANIGHFSTASLPNE